MIHIIDGDLFDTDAKYLVHQVNCCTTKAAHLAYDVFKRYPYADVYSCRDKSNQFGWSSDEIGNEGPYQTDTPGDILIRGNGQDQRYVIGLLGQFYPGRPRYPDSTFDGFKARADYFYQGLLKIGEIKNLESVAFPYQIGCGAAGGDWGLYSKILKNFAAHLEDRTTNKAKVLIYRRKDLV